MARSPRSRAPLGASFALATTALLAGLSLEGRAAPSAPRAARDGDPVDFGRDILPLLSDRCFLCHGPDATTREADLRLDLEDEARADRGGYAVVVPGDRAASELWLRISDPDDPMPPDHAQASLDPEEIERFGRWIDEGATWGEHWAYLPPRRVEPPTVPGVEHPVDRFLESELLARGWVPEVPADPARQLRRLHLDLTGLPPTLEELDAFLADDRPDAYARRIEELFDSPRYGEHMARAWLDAVRYADTHGLHLDNAREIWPYRDWVVGAFQENLPFDRFTVAQLAGDLLPDAGLPERVATGYLRLNPSSGEGGLIELEYLVKYAMDRANTTSTVWMGSTLACAQCHDHKFDPFSQADFYSFLGFFSNLVEAGTDGNRRLPPPSMYVPTPADEEALVELGAELSEARTRLTAPDPALDREQESWEVEWRGTLSRRWSSLAAEARPGAGGFTLGVSDVPAGTRALRLSFVARPEGAAQVDLVELVTQDGQALTLTAAFADAAPVGEEAERALDGEPGDGAGWTIPAGADRRRLMLLLDEPLARGAALELRLLPEPGTPPAALAALFGDARVEGSADPSLVVTEVGPWSTLGPFLDVSSDDARERVFGPERGADLAATYAGETELAWVERPGQRTVARLAFGGTSQVNFLHREFRAPTARTLSLTLATYRVQAATPTTGDELQFFLNGERLASHSVWPGKTLDLSRIELPLRAGANQLVVKVIHDQGYFTFGFQRSDEAVGGLPQSLARALEAQDEEGAVGLRTYFRRFFSTGGPRLWEEVEARQAALAAYERTIPRTLVAQEREKRRPLFLLERGQYDRPGERLARGAPAVLPELATEAGEEPSRLDLARWLVRPDHPLTARVAMNRLWQSLFGHGLVKTTEDFGLQGEQPTHPELLDWLAVEFVESGWDLQAMQRLLLTSAAYRRASDGDAASWARDPENRWLARGPRLRLEAERIRDGVLAVSGLLVERVGGPSVKPYQPEGLWRAVAYPSSNTARFERGAGEDLYRRSLYTYWKRTAPPPMLQLFDAPSRESCNVRRSRTTTPLQALALLNDEQFVEAARALAERSLRGGPDDDGARLDRAFRRVTSRPPTDGERAELLAFLAEARASFADGDPAALLAVGEHPVPSDLDPGELAAWTLVANLLFNLDEFVTKV